MACKHGGIHDIYIYIYSLARVSWRGHFAVKWHHVVFVFRFCPLRSGDVKGGRERGAHESEGACAREGDVQAEAQHCCVSPFLKKRHAMQSHISGIIVQP